MYAKQISREYLEKLGITKVTEDGLHIYKGDVEIKQCLNGGYYMVTLYDKELYDIVYPLTGSHGAGAVTIGVHRLVYAWFNGSANANLVVDHINNNKADNRLENLQLLTQGENAWKDREHNIKEIKCQLKKPRSFYEQKLANYTALYEQAKTDHDAELAHKLRCNISGVRARLRYYDSHCQQQNQN